jgi:ATP-dependent helicase/nuclease subunit A
MKHNILANNLMILASAGSGKTYQLANRVIGLIGAKGVDPTRIVALTFTRKAAGEFADSVLSKLADCAVDSGKATDLCQQIGCDFEVSPVLARVVKALPRFQLGTMDGFFTRIVKAFQYELGLAGGTFDLIEGPRLQAAMNDILASVLGSALDDGEAEEFLHAFRRATVGKEGQGVLRSIEKFLGSWHGWWKSGALSSGWGGEGLFTGLPQIEDWEAQKRPLLASLRSGEEHEAVLRLIDHFELHTVGSGRIAKAGTLFDRLLEAVPGFGEMELPFNRKIIRFSLSKSSQWREVVRLLAGCELAAAVGRTKAVAELVARLDAECERRLRSKGLLGFDDVKMLMGKWVHDEEARVRREIVDFRIDAKYDHWLLDEFQDTSSTEWIGIYPLLEELKYRENDASLFVVGDRKQAIYGWRGGDVTLFDEVRKLHESGERKLEINTMPESWRSCPAVLDLVNCVCGDSRVISGLFGDATARRWEWETHVSAKPGITGEARVEVVLKEEKATRLVELLKEIGIGERALTCGVLVRTNAQVQETAALLREHGFDVIEEGRRHPVEDNPVGVTLFNLIRWLADPADSYAQEVVRMSPLSAMLALRFPGGDSVVWESLLAQAAVHGFAAMVESLVEPFWKDLSAFTRSRAGDIIGALAEFDAGGTSTAREAARWLTDLEITQSPGVAAVQVMTIHKSKGLGFDVVVLPEVEDNQIPDRKNFEIARGAHAGTSWLLEPPPQWVRGLIPPLANAEEAWADEQRYESLCVLYVALTRAKRGLYVFLPEVPKTRKESEGWKSLTNWISQTAGPDFQSGDPGWFRHVPLSELKTAAATPELGPAVPRRARFRPSSSKSTEKHSSEGLRYGSEIHEAIERVGWLDEPSGPPLTPGIAKILSRPEVARWLQRRGRNVELYREQPLEALVDGFWLSGTIDRLHVERDDSGKVTSLEVLDFKTDRDLPEADLIARYSRQMTAYRSALAEAYPGARIHCVLISTALGTAIPCGNSPTENI